MSLSTTKGFNFIHLSAKRSCCHSTTKAMDIIWSNVEPTKREDWQWKNKLWGNYVLPSQTRFWKHCGFLQCKRKTIPKKHQWMNIHKYEHYVCQSVEELQDKGEVETYDDWYVSQFPSANPRKRPRTLPNILGLHEKGGIDTYEEWHISQLLLQIWVITLKNIKFAR